MPEKLLERPTQMGELRLLFTTRPQVLDKEPPTVSLLYQNRERQLGKESEVGFPPLFTPAAFDKRVRTDPLFRQSVAGFTSMGFEQFKRGITPKGLCILPYGNPGEELLYVSNTKSTMEAIFGHSHPKDTNDATELRDRNSAYGEIASILESLHFHSRLSFEEVSREVTTWEELQVYLLDPSSDRYRTSPARGILSNLGIRGSSLPAIADQLRRRAGVQVVYKASEEFFDFVRNQEHYLDPNEDQAMALTSLIPSKYILAVIPYGSEEKAYYREHGVQRE